MRSLSDLRAFVRDDLAKVLRFVAVSVITVPAGVFLLWVFLQTDMRPFVANVVAVAIATVPNYLLNRYWVWRKRGRNSISREIAPFWAMAFLGLCLSTGAVWIAERSTDSDPVFLVLNVVSFGVVWVVKFFVLERFLFGHDPNAVVEPARV